MRTGMRSFGVVIGMRILWFKGLPIQGSMVVSRHISG